MQQQPVVPVLPKPNDHLHFPVDGSNDSNAELYWFLHQSK